MDDDAWTAMHTPAADAFHVPVAPVAGTSGAKAGVGAGAASAAEVRPSRPKWWNTRGTVGDKMAELQQSSRALACADADGGGGGGPGAVATGPPTNFLAVDGQPFACLEGLEHETLLSVAVMASQRFGTESPCAVANLVAAHVVPPASAAVHPVAIAAMFPHDADDKTPLDWLTKGRDLAKLAQEEGQGAVLALAAECSVLASVWEFVRRDGVYTFPRAGGFIRADGHPKASQGGGFHGLHGIERRVVRALLDLVVLYMEEFVHDSRLAVEHRRPVLSLRDGPGALLPRVTPLFASYVVSALFNARRMDVNETRRTGQMTRTARGARLRPGVGGAAVDFLGAAATCFLGAETLSDEEGDDVTSPAGCSPSLSFLTDGSYETRDANARTVREAATGTFYRLTRGAYARVTAVHAAAERIDLRGPDGRADLFLVAARAPELLVADTELPAGVRVDAVDGVVHFDGPAGEAARQALARAYEEVLLGMAHLRARHSSRSKGAARVVHEFMQGQAHTHARRTHARDTVVSLTALATEEEPELPPITRLPTVTWDNLVRRKPVEPLLADDGTVLKRPVGRPRTPQPPQPDALYPTLIPDASAGGGSGEDGSATIKRRRVFVHEAQQRHVHDDDAGLADDERVGERTDTPHVRPLHSRLTPAAAAVPAWAAAAATAAAASSTAATVWGAGANVTHAAATRAGPTPAKRVRVRDRTGEAARRRQRNAAAKASAETATEGFVVDEPGDDASCFGGNDAACFSGNDAACFSGNDTGANDDTWWWSDKHRTAAQQQHTRARAAAAASDACKCALPVTVTVSTSEPANNTRAARKAAAIANAAEQSMKRRLEDAADKAQRRAVAADGGDPQACGSSDFAVAAARFDQEDAADALDNAALDAALIRAAAVHAAQAPSWSPWEELEHPDAWGMV